MAKTLGLVVLLGLACDQTEAPPVEDTEARDIRAVTFATEALDGTPRFAHFGSIFAVDPLTEDDDPNDLDAIRRDAVQGVRERLTLVFAAIGCDATIDSDDDRTLSLTLRSCHYLQWDFDVELEAVARVETRACEEGTCPTAVIWALDIAELASGPSDGPQARFVGPLEFRAPFDPSELMRWETFPGFVLQGPVGLSFDTLSTASWAVDDDKCITLDFGARLTPQQREDELDELIGDVVIAARGVRHCPLSCADEGEVQLTFGTGQVLGWSYEGESSIVVQGPRGREVEVSLSCG